MRHPDESRDPDLILKEDGSTQIGIDKDRLYTVYYYPVWTKITSL